MPQSIIVSYSALEYSYSSTLAITMADSTRVVSIHQHGESIQTNSIKKSLSTGEDDKRRDRQSWCSLLYYYNLHSLQASEFSPTHAYEIAGHRAFCPSYYILHGTMFVLHRPFHLISILTLWRRLQGLFSSIK